MAPHSQPDASANRDCRARGDERRTRRIAEKRGERGTVERCYVAVERRCDGSQDRPSRMLDLVLYRATVSLTGIAPVMLRDERLFRVIVRNVWSPGEIEGEPVPPLRVEPLVDRTAR